jgi:hypothetical protein
MSICSLVSIVVSLTSTCNSLRSETALEANDNLSFQYRASLYFLLLYPKRVEYVVF